MPKRLAMAQFYDGVIAGRIRQVLSLFVSPVSCFCCVSYVTGWLVDWTHDFSASFYLSGLCLVLSGVFVVLVDRLVEKKKLKLPNPYTETTDHPILKADSADV